MASILSPGVQRYGRVLSTTAGRHLAAGGFVGRLREGGASIAILLTMHQTGTSLQTASTASGAYLICAAISRPFQASLLNLFGHRRVLIAITLVNTIALSTFALVALLGGTPPVLVVFAALSGITLPAITVSLRQTWPRTVIDPDLRLTAYALDGALYEIALVLGPTIVSVVAALYEPMLALFALATCGLVGTVLVALSTPDEPRKASLRVAPASEVTNHLAAVLVAVTFIGVFQGTLVVVIAAIAVEHNQPSASGFLLSFLSLGSLVGGLLYGARDWRASIPGRVLVTSALLTAGSLALHVPADLRTFAGLVLLAGMAWAPTMTAIVLLLQDRLPASRTTAAFAWLSLFTKSGESAGTALAGLVIATGGTQAALWQVSAATAAVAVTCFVGQRVWRQPS